jgi:hypothetical protein
MIKRPGRVSRGWLVATLTSMLACEGPRNDATMEGVPGPAPAAADAATRVDGGAPSSPLPPPPSDAGDPPAPDAAVPGPDGPSGLDATASPPPPACAGTTTRCGQACVDTRTDPRNCGACGTVCANFQGCSAGRCSPQYEVTVASGTVPGAAWDLALAPDGAMYAAGIFKGSIDFDPGPSEQRFTAMGDGDVFVTKFDSAGAYQWTRTIASAAAEPYVHAFGTADGGVVLSGPYRGSATFYPGQAAAMKTARTAAGDEAYLLKIAGDGSFGFVRTFPATGYSVVFDVDGLADGSLVAVGPFAGPIDFGDGDQLAGVAGGFAVRLSTAGMTVWARTFAGAATATVRGSSTGGLVLAGGFTGTLDLDPGPGTVEATAQAGMSLYTVGLDGTGRFEGGGAVSFHGATEVAPRDLIQISDGAVYVAGDYKGGAVSLEAGAAARTRPNAGAGDAFVVKLGPTFAHAWGRSYGGAGADYAWSVASVPSGVQVAGKIASERVDFGVDGAPDLRELSAGDVFVLGLGPAAEPRGVFTLGPPRAASPILLRASASALLLAGFFSGSIDFDPRTPDQDLRTAAPIQSAFVSRFLF